MVNIGEAVNEFKGRRDFGLLLLFGLHLVFSSWTMLGSWGSDKFVIQNAFLLLCIMWALRDEKSETPVMLGLFIEIFSILNDIIILSLYFPKFTSTARFSAVMAVFNLGVRFIGIVGFHTEWNARTSDPHGNVEPDTRSGNQNGFETGIEAVTFGKTPTGVLPNRPPSASGSMMSSASGYQTLGGNNYTHNQEHAYGYSQNPYQGALPGKTDPLPEIPPSYTHHA